MRLNGETYACDACVRGHRASKCEHYDRHLQTVSRKGRPVSQCSHCRSLRMSRSVHIKCNCGKRTKNGAQQNESVNSTEACYCSSGRHCICATNKKKRADQAIAAEPAPDNALPSPGQVVNNLDSNWENFLNLDALGHLDENTCLANAPAKCFREQFAQPISGHTDRSLASYKPRETQKPATPETAMRTFESNSDQRAYQQRRMLRQSADLSSISYVADIDSELPNRLPVTAQHMPFTDLRATNWNHNQLGALNGNVDDNQMLNSTDCSWFALRGQIHTGTSGLGELPETPYPFTTAAELRLGDVASFHQAWNSSLDAVIGNSETDELTDQHNPMFNENNVS